MNDIVSIIYYVWSIVWLDIAAIGNLMLVAVGIWWISRRFGIDD